MNDFTKFIIGVFAFAGGWWIMSQMGLQTKGILFGIFLLLIVVGLAIKLVRLAIRAVRWIGGKL